MAAHAGVWKLPISKLLSCKWLQRRSSVRFKGSLRLAGGRGMHERRGASLFPGGFLRDGGQDELVAEGGILLLAMRNLHRDA